MKVMQLSINGIQAVRPVIVDGARGKFLALTHGEEGRGRWQIRMPLAVRDFPVPADGEPAFLEGHVGLKILDKKDKRGNPILLLTKGEEDRHFLVLWYLSPGYRGGASYAIEGQARVLAEGYQAQVLAGRMSGAACPVVLVEGPCRLSWKRTGRLYGTPSEWLAEFDGENWTVSEATACDIETAAFEY